MTAISLFGLSGAARGCMGLVCLFSIGFWNSGLLARDASVATLASVSTLSDQFAVGDRLRIALYEQMGEGGALANLLERTEVTGEYVVQADGSVYFPLVGSVQFASRTPRDVENAVSERLQSAMKGRIKLVIQLIDREPIYIVGRGARSQTLKFSPGMTMMHALALSGSGDASGIDLWRRLDLSREEERLSRADERLIRLIAKRDVLLAERSESRVTASNTLRSVGGAARGDEALAEEARIRSVQIEEHTRKIAAIDALEDAVAREIEVQRSRVSHLDRVLKERAQRLKTVTEHRQRGVATETSLQTAVIEADVARERWHEANVVLAQSERRLAEVRQEKARALAEHILSREMDLREVSAAINEEVIARGKMWPVVMSAAPDAANLAGDSEYFILRRGAAGLERIVAAPTTPLVPGDLIEVRMPVPRSFVNGNLVSDSAISGDGAIEKSSKDQRLRVN
ncbi:MAG: polysaccharide biosynthesis/export family protein [Beijerinckiaceae bacterium]